MPREQERVPFLVEIILESSSGRREARISDISMSGCYIDSIATAREGEAVSFEVPRPGGEAMKFTGEVAYALEGFGFGIRFTDLTDEKKSFIEEIIRAQNQ